MILDTNVPIKINVFLPIVNAYINLTMTLSVNRPLEFSELYLQ